MPSVGGRTFNSIRTVFLVAFCASSWPKRIGKCLQSFSFLVLVLDPGSRGARMRMRTKNENAGSRGESALLEKPPQGDPCLLCPLPLPPGQIFLHEHDRR